MTKPALLGGAPVRTAPWPTYRTIGEEEKRRVMRVLDSGVLSRYIGAWGEDFWGGEEVRAFEAAARNHFKVAHALAVNSATSALYAAVGAAGVGPGDEVIVSPYTMSASATAAVVWGGVPVFADLEPETFCLDPESIRARITPKTKAIIAVDLFGHPADFKAIMAIAEEHDLVVIEDAAQAPDAEADGRKAGTLAHIGCFSLNYHKHIHTGEGGICVTDDDRLARRIALIRNHAESVVEGMGETELDNMVGFNFRMTEVEAAIGIAQLEKLSALVDGRIEKADRLTEKLAAIPGLAPPAVRPGVRHAYYCYPIRFDAGTWGAVHRDTLARALNAEGVPFRGGYVKPIYLMPMYKNRIALGRDGFPFTESPQTAYGPGLCPVTERLEAEELLLFVPIHSQIEDTDLDDVAEAFAKLWENRPLLAEHQRSAA
ncbi:MAG: DegT/DnrJ/EryC1/StrS family aminotransferase [Rhodospirillaceae bacterium]|jgi:perosamine synthetase|nr:DegT/DnrJ/EryC1/StrS family aminotransferase [Rhodospirillaceae bacterium]MBT6117645.1 DegT/DnrJ/EryC1/StrS family aminotransferase [Rhodospirillaceae bacterium]